MHLPRYPAAEVGVNTVTREVYEIQECKAFMEINAARRLAVSW
jgi:hypothetical protein